MLYPYPIGPNRPSNLLHAPLTNPVLKAALAAGAPEAVAAARALEEFKTAAAALPDAAAGITAADLADTLLAGKALPKDLLAKVGERAAAEGAMFRTRGMLQETHEFMTAAIDGKLRQAEPAIGRHLHAVLGELIEQHHAAARGDGTPREVQARQADIADQYIVLRAAHTAIVGRLWSHQPHELGELAVMQTPGAAWQWWSAWRRHKHLANRQGRRRPLNPPWPALDSPAMLGWLADHPNAQPWIPTQAEWNQANDRAQETLRRDSQARPAGHTEPDDGNGYLDPSYFEPTRTPDKWIGQAPGMTLIGR